MIEAGREFGRGQAGPLAKLGGRFQFNTSMFELLTDDFASDEWRKLSGRGNSAHWILGHLCTMRLSLLRTLGVEQPDMSWEPQFTAGGDMPPVGGTYPEPRALLECFHGTGEKLIRALETTSPIRAQSEWTEGHFDLPVTVEDCVGFFYFDETFHLGQLGLARQQLGKPRVI